MKKHFIRLSALFLFCFAAISAVSAAENSVRVDLSVEKNFFRYNESVPVQVTISNSGQSDAKILRWLTPVDGVKEDLFTVTVNGKAVEYTGVHIKRPAPVESDYIVLKSGETLVGTVNIDDYYDLSLSGEYQIAYRAESYNLFSEQTLMQQNSETLESKSISFFAYEMTKKMPPYLSDENYTNIGCSTSQATNITSAVNNANYYAVNSLNYLSAGTIDTRYTTWFGVYDATRYATVRTHFSNIRNLISVSSYRINCGCTDPYYAYVYASDSTHTIYVCNAFWTAPTTGTDSKAGTLIHEMSHFNDIGGTDDHVYGQSGARNLAVNNPANAVNNADNHEYFAEASPGAALASVSGRVLSSAGRGVAGASVKLASSTGTTFTTRTNSFGYYRFSGIETGQNYVVSASAKRFSFTDRSISLNQDLSNIDFTVSARK